MGGVAFLPDDVLVVLTRDAQGKENALGVEKLYEAVFGVPPRDKINTTRVIREAITALRGRGDKREAGAPFPGDGGQDPQGESGGALGPVEAQS